MYEFRIIKIGRDTTNDIVINHHSISRNHLEVFINEEGIVFVTDLQSSNGSYINGKRIFGTEILHPGDILRLGVERPIKWQLWLKQVGAVQNGAVINEVDLFDSNYIPQHSFFSKNKIPIIAFVVVVVAMLILSQVVKS